MNLLVNDRGVVTKRADRGSCVVKRDCENYVAEAEKITKGFHRL